MRARPADMASAKSSDASERGRTDEAVMSLGCRAARRSDRKPLDATEGERADRMPFWNLPGELYTAGLEP